MTGWLIVFTRSDIVTVLFLETKMWRCVSIKVPKARVLRRRRCQGGGGVGGDVTSPLGERSGEGLCPLARIFFKFLLLNIASFAAF